MGAPKEMRESIETAGKLQAMMDRILSYGFVPRWLPLQAACFYGGIGEKKMLDHIKAGRIYGHMDGDKWIVDRISIDEYHEGDKKTIQDKVQNILEKFGTKR